MSKNVYLTARQVCERYNRKSTVWLYRRVKNDENFPRPIFIAGQKYFRLAELEAYESDPARQVAPTVAANKDFADSEAV